MTDFGRWVFRCVLWAGFTAFAPGCRQANQPVAQDEHVQVRIGSPQEQSPSDPAARPEQIESAIHSDPCAARLQDISGALLEYLAIHNRMPATLAELNTLPDLDQPLTFACPSSAKPFVYVPAGLISPTDPRQIVLYDSAVDRAGLRWVIRLRRPRGRESAATFVEHMPQSVFQSFAPVSQ